MTGTPTDRSSRDDVVDCAILVVTYNSAQYVRSLVDSLAALGTALTTRVVAVDNDSTDDTVALLRKHSDVEVVEAGANLGYAGGINRARRHAGRAASYLVLNPDLTIEPGFLDLMVEGLATPGTGVTVPRIVGYDGLRYPSLRREPTLGRALGDALFGGRLRGRPAWLGEMIYEDAAYAVPGSADWATGAVMLISAACDDAVGDWDERFFLYSEETDFCARVRAAGFGVRYVPSALVRHRIGGSGASDALVALMAVNRVRYYAKHHGTVATLAYRGLVILHELLRVSAPAHRAALRAVVRRARWSDLPAATGPSR